MFLSVRSHAEKRKKKKKEKKNVLLSLLPPLPLWLPTHVMGNLHPRIDLWAQILHASPQGTCIDLTLLSVLLTLNYASWGATQNL